MTTFDDVEECLQYVEKGYILGSHIEDRSYWMKIAPWTSVGNPPVVKSTTRELLGPEDVEGIKDLFVCIGVPVQVEYWGAGSVLVSLNKEHISHGPDVLHELITAGYVGWCKDVLKPYASPRYPWNVFPYRYPND